MAWLWEWWLPALPGNGHRTPILARTQGKTAGGTSWRHSHNTGSAQGHSSLLILCFPLPSSLEKPPERSQGESRVTQACRETSHSLWFVVKPAPSCTWPLPGCPSQNGNVCPGPREGTSLLPEEWADPALSSKPAHTASPGLQKCRNSSSQTSWKWQEHTKGWEFLGYHHHQHGCEMLVGTTLCNFFEISVLDLKNEFVFNP